MEILRKRVVSPIDTSPLMIFFCFLLLFHWMVSSGDRMMATPAFASLEGWLGGGQVVVIEGWFFRSLLGGESLLLGRHQFLFFH